MKTLKTAYKLGYFLLMIELITSITCKNLNSSHIWHNSTISSNLTALVGTTCQTSSDCLFREGCHEGICYTLKSQIDTFLAAFFGGFFGADWFYLSRGRAQFIIAGIFKLFTLGGIGVWWLADWIIVASNGCSDAFGLPLDSTNWIPSDP